MKIDIDEYHSDQKDCLVITGTKQEIASALMRMTNVLDGEIDKAGGRVKVEINESNLNVILCVNVNASDESRCDKDYNSEKPKARRNTKGDVIISSAIALLCIIIVIVAFIKK